MCWINTFAVVKASFFLGISYSAYNMHTTCTQRQQRVAAGLKGERDERLRLHPLYTVVAAALS